MASTSRLRLDDIRSDHNAKGKQRGEETNVDLKTVAIAFVRRGTIVRKCFDKWKKRAIDRAMWTEACARSDMYKEQVHRSRLSRSTSSVADRSSSPPTEKRQDQAMQPVSTTRHDRQRRRRSSQYRPPVTDDVLVKRLKEVRGARYVVIHVD